MPTFDDCLNVARREGDVVRRRLGNDGFPSGELGLRETEAVPLEVIINAVIAYGAVCCS